MDVFVWIKCFFMCFVARVRVFDYFSFVVVVLKFGIVGDLLDFFLVFCLLLNMFF